MGYTRHDAIIVTAAGHAEQPDIEAFRQSLPEQWRPLVIGPVLAVINDYVTYAFLPDGSYEHWDISDDGNRYRSRFAALFSAGYEDGSTPFDVVKVRFGGDDNKTARAVPQTDYARLLP